jgi:iron(III) transport system permease protein
MMEVLNDYGLVRYYGVDTFTTGIFTAWFAFGNASAAMRLSAYLMVFVLALIVLERYQRGQMKYTQIDSHFKPARVHRLKGANALAAMAVSFIPLLAGFIIPVSMLIWWSFQTAAQVLDQKFWALLQNSFLLAAAAALLVLAAALLISFAVRMRPSRLTRVLARIATLGYALPGAVVAIGILITFLWLEQKSSPILRISLTGTWLALLYAYLVRFLAVGHNSVDSGMDRLSPSLHEASLALGRSGKQTLWKVVMPLLRGPMISAALLVFIDVLKELPLTLILRPFNFDTLAIRAFEYATDERVAEAAPAALIIILVGLAPVIILNRMLGNKTTKKIDE